MAENDLAERIQRYASFLEDKLRAEALAVKEESLQGAITADQRWKVYCDARNQLYRLCPEAKVTLPAGYQPKTE